MKYDHIIDLPHHISKKHPQMSIRDRAAQFSSFKALTGFEDEIGETARLTDKYPELTEEKENDLNQKFQMLEEISKYKPLIELTYFKKDLKKSGGAFITVSGNFRVIDYDVLKFTNGIEVPVADIIDVKLADSENL